MATKLDARVGLTLPAGFTARGAKLDDVETSLDLFNRWSRSVIGEDEITDAAAIRNEWISPGFDPAEDIRLVFALDGTLVGYIEVWMTAKPPVHPWLWGRIHPDYSGLGLGTWLLTWAEKHALKALDDLTPGLRFAPRIGTYNQATDSQKLFVDLGYRRIRSNYQMRIALERPPSEPVWPEGITVRTYNPENDLEAVYLADQDVFRDHFGFVETPIEVGLERFEHFMTSYEGFDPSLWFIAWDGTELAGICLCRPNSFDDPDLGHINVLGVRRLWRKRGLGLALLQHAFGEFYRRGKRKASLGVDAENLTGALRLYEKAGMHVHRQFELFEKELRPGKEISVQSLAE
jgi:mycothiol synthase